MKSTRDMLVDELKAAVTAGALGAMTARVFESTLDVCALLKKVDVIGTPDAAYAIAVANEGLQDALKEWLIHVQAR
jgi:hypothetical protein